MTEKAATQQKYISLMKLTEKGLLELGDSPKRREVSEARVAAVGGRSLAFYAVMGAYDFVQVFEMPDNEAMMRYVLTARRDGHVDPLILPAFDTGIWNDIVGHFQSA